MYNHKEHRKYIETHHSDTEGRRAVGQPSGFPRGLDYSYDPFRITYQKCRAPLLVCKIKEQGAGITYDRGWNLRRVGNCGEKGRKYTGNKFLYEIGHAEYDEINTLFSGMKIRREIVIGWCACLYCFFRDPCRLQSCRAVS